MGTGGLTLSHEMLFLIEGKLLCGKKVLDQEDQDAEFCSGIFPVFLTSGGRILSSLSLSVPFCNWQNRIYWCLDWVVVKRQTGAWVQQMLPNVTSLPDISILQSSLDPFGISFQLPLVHRIQIQFSPLLWGAVGHWWFNWLRLYLSHSRKCLGRASYC